MLSLAFGCAYVQEEALPCSTTANKIKREFENREQARQPREAPAIKRIATVLLLPRRLLLPVRCLQAQLLPHLLLALPTLLPELDPLLEPLLLLLQLPEPRLKLRLAVRLPLPFRFCDLIKRVLDLRPVHALLRVAVRGGVLGDRVEDGEQSAVLAGGEGTTLPAAPSLYGRQSRLL